MLGVAAGAAVELVAAATAVVLLVPKVKDEGLAVSVVNVGSLEAGKLLNVLTLTVAEKETWKYVISLSTMDNFLTHHISKYLTAALASVIFEEGLEGREIKHSRLTYFHRKIWS